MTADCSTGRIPASPSGFQYNVALPEPALYGQFQNMDDIDYILNGLLALGFQDVFEVARAAELRKAGELPPETNRALEVACRAVEGGVRRAALLAPGADHILLLDALGQHIQGISVTP